jgi:hypothetical protein
MLRLIVMMTLALAALWSQPSICAAPPTTTNSWLLGEVYLADK